MNGAPTPGSRGTRDAFRRNGEPDDATSSANGPPPRIQRGRTSSKLATVRLPSRRILLLSLLLLAAGAVLLVFQYLGTFNTPDCPPGAPPDLKCPEIIDPWPLFLGTALWVSGLAIFAAGVAALRGARKAQPAPPKAEEEKVPTSPPTPVEANTPVERVPSTETK